MTESTVRRIAVCLAALLTSLPANADPLKPAIPSWHLVNGKPYIVQMDDCPSDTPLYRDGVCVSEAWLKLQHDSAPATQADIDRLQRQIDEMQHK